MNKRNLRADVAIVVFNVLERGQSLRDCLPEVLEPHSSKDKAWIQEMVYGVLRHLPQLQVWLRELLAKPLKNKQKVIEHLLLVGLYQLAFTRVSTHAAVAESVNAAMKLKSPGLKGLVNAILRNFIRQQLKDTPSRDPIITSGLPSWLYKKLATDYSLEQLSLMIDQMKEKAPLWLRVNTCQKTVADYCQQLDAIQQQYHLSEHHRDAIVLQGAVDIINLPGYQQGWFTVQDGAAQLAADYLSTDTNQRILDACAAPGGKTTHLLQRQHNQLHCTALDIEESRMVRTQENLKRLQFDADVIIGDAASPGEWWDKQNFDHILLDAPCSATGVIRRHPDIKWHRKASDIDNLVSLQAKILDSLWQTLAPGGSLLYATCSILPQENQQQVDAFVARTDDAQTAPLSSDSTDVSRQILPGEDGMDGFFYAKLIKVSPTA